ncbi:MAG TPA: FAD-binding protein [Spirochaetes bacterium]|nr:FAD-binding protein [Spirochaetota bacterium]
MYDIIIIGAGPAGSTLARLAGNRHNILLLDKRQRDDEKSSANADKCCGGLLAPDAQNTLARMGLGVPREVIAGPQLFAVRTIDLAAGIEQYYQRHYINLDHEKFDRWLASLVPPSVERRFGLYFKGAVIDKSGVTVRYGAKGKDYTARCRLLVGADGAHSLVRRRADPAVRPQTYIAVQQWFRADHPLPYFSAFFDPEITDFYGWTIPKEDGIILGAALPQRDRVNERFELLKRKLASYGFSFAAPFKKSGSLLLRPVRLNQLSAGNGPIALIGEAGGWISPSSAEGISYAFRTAGALARALDPFPEGVQKRYRRGLRALTMNILLKNAKSPFMYSPLLRRLVMRSGLMSLKME